MAVDEAMLIALVEGRSPPTVRLYGWSQPCLNLGRAQPLADADLAVCRAAGVEVVRRVSGGRAVLNSDELSYAVALPGSDPRAAGGVLASYRHLSDGLVAGLRSLGVDASQAMDLARDRRQTRVCFESLSDYEIVAGTRKLVGSAQWRSRGGVLQHGTMALCGDLTRIAVFLTLGSEDAREEQRCTLRTCATTLKDVLGRAVPFAEAASALAAGFRAALNVTLAPGELTPYERELAAELARTRYASSDWTERT